MDSSRPKQAAPQPRSKNTPKEHARSVAPVSNKTTDEQTGERGARSRLAIVPPTEEQHDEEQALSIKRDKTARPSHLPSRRRTQTTLEQAIEDYLHDHEGGNHSHKTIEWHRTALTLLHTYLHTHRGMTLVEEIDAPDISAWFTYLRKTPGGHGKIRSERTIQTYARSVRAFFHWLVRQGTVQDNPFDRVVFPKVGKPLIQTITDEEFERLLRACTLPTQRGFLDERAAARNRAILWLFYDTGIRVSELITLREEHLDRKRGVITVKGKGSKERRIALGQNCLRQVLSYLDRYRPNQEELTAWGCPEEDHLFLSETREPLTKNGMTLLFARLKKRAGIRGKRISPHIFRHTFAIRYLILGNDPFSLQELLGHEDMTTVKNYMHMNDETIQAQKRKYSPGDHLSTLMPGPKDSRRRGFQATQRSQHKK